MPETTALKRLFEYKAWANAEMLAAMAQLGDGVPTTEIAIRTLNHTHIVDRIFSAHMKGTDHGFSSANADRAPTLAELSAATRAVDQDLIAYVASLDGDRLAEQIDFTFTDGAPGRMSREEMLMHLITHGGLHRGQIGWIMTLGGVTPPADGLAGYLHKAEAATRRRGSERTTPATPTHTEDPRPVRQVSPHAGPPLARLEALTAELQNGLGGEVRFDKTVKFDLKGEGFIFIDAERASNEDRPADLTLTVSIDDLRAIGQNRLSTMSAVTSGRLGLSDMGVAMSQLGTLKALFAKIA